MTLHGKLFKWGLVAIIGLLSPCVSGLAEPVPALPPDRSLKKELARAIDGACDYLLAHQAEDGSWSDADYPAITALALAALQGDPEEHHAEKKAEVLKKGYRYLVGSVQPNGGIYRIESLTNYNTAVSVLAFVVANDPAYHEIIQAGRKYLIRGQQDFRAKGKRDNVLDGGIGYGDRYPHSDMSNTVLALEAIYHSRHLVQDTAKMADDNLDWDAVIQFVQNCQNLPETNQQAWVSGDDANRGGFVYFPGDSKAGEMTLPSGRTALRSYGSISYAGLLSYIYAEMDFSDKRVQAVREWLERNYTLDENPFMGAQGLYYYFYTMSKALSLAGIEELKMKDGKSVRWAAELALKMLDLQRSEGQWVNDNARWWEKDAVLVTAYGLLTVQNLYRSL
ncbi:MAG: hypothetical protein M2R45_02384 [Verrucomicrobia subdivision 3 bacterium]|nr:hypothetical protein [Limisphaerales bacterium]MCS1414934.1 hypothetical protein [Limisphaerales bacterium]